MRKNLFVIILVFMSQVLSFSVSAVASENQESYQFVVRSNNVTPGRFTHVNAPALHEIQGVLESSVSFTGISSIQLIQSSLKKISGNPGSLFEKIFKSKLISCSDFAARLNESETTNLFLDHLVLLI